MFNQAHDFWFGLAIMLMWLGNILDVVSTRIGIWNYGLSEGNPIYKLLPAKARTFLFETIVGTCIDGALRFGMLVAFIVGAGDTGHANDASAWLPAVLGIGSLVVAARNYLLFRKGKYAPKNIPTV